MLSNILVDLDYNLGRYGIKHIFIESGDAAIANKLEEIYGTEIPDTLDIHAKYWCEISWGSGYDEVFEAAVNSFGLTLGQSIENCLIFFSSLVKEGSESYVAIAKHFGIYDPIIEDKL